MTMPEAISYQPRAVPLRLRLLVRLVVLSARLLGTRSPRRIRSILRFLHKRSRPATYAEAQAARNAVVTVSLSCAGREGCLTRSLATVLLGRVRGQWPAWCVGVRRLPPFSAHSWVEADGKPVDEDYPADYFQPFFKVP